jgi:hypothetical protein
MVTYETIVDLSQPFVKLMNVGEQIIVNNVYGYLQVRISLFKSVAVIGLLTVGSVPACLLFDEFAHSAKNHLFCKGMESWIW